MFGLAIVWSYPALYLWKAWCSVYCLKYDQYLPKTSAFAFLLAKNKWKKMTFASVYVVVWVFSCDSTESKSVLRVLARSGNTAAVFVGGFSGDSQLYSGQKAAAKIRGLVASQQSTPGYLCPLLEHCSQLCWYPLSWNFWIQRAANVSCWWLS